MRLILVGPNTPFQVFRTTSIGTSSRKFVGIISEKKKRMQIEILQMCPNFLSNADDVH
jgi:hypothetical protein